MNHIRVASLYDAKKYLDKLPENFKAVKVESGSLKTTVWRRLIRNVEEALQVKQALFGKDAEWEDFAEYLTKLLSEQGYETDDLRKTLIVIGDKSGTLSGRTFNQSNYQRLITDLNQFDADYPIFIDTSAVKYLFADNEPIQYTKRDRSDETFQSESRPPAKKVNPETLEDLMEQWAEEREQFQEEIDALKKRESQILEQNQLLIEECGKREEDLQAAVTQCQEERSKSAREIAEFQDQIRRLKIEPMEFTMGEAEEEEEDQTQERPPVEEIPTPKRSVPTRSARISGLFGDYFDPLLDNDAAEAKNVSGKGGQSWTLAKIGMTMWDPSTTSFLDYLETFETSVAAVNVTHAQAIVLLFSALPPKYAYLRSIASKQPSFNVKDFESAADILRKLIIGGPEKIFSEFEKLQKRPNEEFLQFLEKLRNFYQWTMDDASKIDTDPTAYRMIKSKMVQAYPSRFVPEFKRRLENKNSLNDIFAAILDMNENFPDIALDGGNSGSNNGTDMMALRKKFEDWQKTVKCFKCGKRGHIKKNCWKRESKTQKTGRKDE